MRPPAAELVARNLNHFGCAVLNLVFPPHCAYCHAELPTNRVQPELCTGCVERVFTPSQPACPRCGTFGVVFRETEGRCPVCQNKDFCFDAVHALGEYTGPLRSAVLRMKYEHGQPLGAALGQHLAVRVEQNDRNDPPDLVTCITKYWLKRLLSGVNSAETLMSSYARRSRIPALGDVLICRRNTSKQSMLSPEQRRRNVTRAWAVSRGYDLGDTHILLVDDIMTTGATASEAARALKKAGARRVTVAVVGRATSPGK